MNLKESLDEIFLLGGRINQPAKNYGLESIKRVLSLLDNPERKVPYFHITGTKGKGSTTNYIHAILRAAHYNTGMYISPSLISTLERISINGELIKPVEFVSYWRQLKDIYRGIEEDKRPSTFETFTIIAFLYFLDKHVDMGVLEVGLGGRLDATNVIERNLCAVITDISFDHQKYLGNTLKEIAFEKSKIIKKFSPVVVGVQNEEPLSVIINEARTQNAPYFIFGKDFFVEHTNFHKNGIEFNFISKTHNRRIEGIKLNGFAPYQMVDAALAIQAILASGVEVSDEAILNGLRYAFWPARFEIISESPLVILDGAHNDASSRALKEAIQRFTQKKVVLLFSMLADKNVYEFLLNIHDVVSKIVITTVPNSYSRAMSPYEILNIAKNFFNESNILIEPNVRSAYYNTKSSLKDDEVLLITGSLYLTGYVRMLENVFTFISK